MTRVAKTMRKVMVGTLLTGGLLFQTAPMTGCDEAALSAFQKGFEYGYNHPEILDEILDADFGGSACTGDSYGGSRYEPTCTDCCF